jgi:hypothetical protein
MKYKWKGFTATERAAIIGGIFLLFTSILIPLISYLKTDTIDLRIIDISSVQIETNHGIEILFWNKSNLPIALTLIKLVLKNSDSMREPLEQRIYNLNTIINILSDSTGYIKGTDIPKISDIPQNYVSYPISGNFRYSKNMDNWSIYFNIPVREELMPGRNRAIIIRFPERIVVIKDQESKSHSIESDLNKQELIFSKMINDCKGPIQVLISIVYADGKELKLQTSLVFNNSE